MLVTYSFKINSSKCNVSLIHLQRLALFKDLTRHNKDLVFLYPKFFKNFKMSILKVL